MKRLNIFSQVLTLMLALAASFFLGQAIIFPVANAQGTNPPLPPGNSPAGTETFGQCVGPHLAEYMNAIIEMLGTNTSIDLLSPVFNGTSHTFDDIINNMNQSGANWSGLDGLAINIYNTGGKTVTEWLDEKLAQAPAGARNLPITITETGMLEGDYNQLAAELNKLNADPRIQSTLIFNAYGENPDSRFQYNNGFIEQYCASNDCSKIGNNTATFYGTGSSQSPGNSYLSIADCGNVQGTVNTIRNLPEGVTPIIRIGVGESAHGCENPETYANFLIEVTNQSGRNISAIAGPNEPDLENWLFPECGDPIIAIFGPQMCSGSEEPDGAYTSRPADCLTCGTYVPHPIDACSGNLNYKNEIRFHGFAQMTCEQLECDVNEDNCQVELGGENIADRVARGEDIPQLMIGPVPWNGRFTLNARSVILPFAGNDTEESLERYIADYLDGTLYYKSPITIGSRVPPPSQDPANIYARQAQKYYEIPPTDPRFVSYAGVINKLAPQTYLDELKWAMIERIGEVTTSAYTPVHDYSLRAAWTGLSVNEDDHDELAKLSDFHDNNSTGGYNEARRRKPLPSSDWEAYETALAEWKRMDGGKWERLWSYVPMTSRSDTPGQFQPIIQSPAVLQEIQGDGISWDPAPPGQDHFTNPDDIQPGTQVQPGENPPPGLPSPTPTTEPDPDAEPSPTTPSPSETPEETAPTPTQIPENITQGISIDHLQAYVDQIYPKHTTTTQTSVDNSFASVVPFSPTLQTDTSVLLSQGEPGAGPGSEDPATEEPTSIPGQTTDADRQVNPTNQLEEAPPTIQLQLPHLARLYEAQHIINTLIAPAEPGARTNAPTANANTFAQTKSESIALASSEIINPFNDDTSNLLAQTETGQPTSPECAANSTGSGCYPGYDAPESCFTSQIENIRFEQTTANGGILHYGVRSIQTCQTETYQSGNPVIGDCQYWGGGGTPQAPVGKGVDSGPNGTYIDTTYDYVGLMPVPISCGESTVIDAHVRCPQVGNNLCCQQEVQTTCRVTVDENCNVTSDCQVSNPDMGIPLAPVCEPTRYGSVPQCNGDIRTGPGDRLCGQHTYDIIVQNPDERFWNTNPNETSLLLPGSSNRNPDQFTPEEIIQEQRYGDCSGAYNTQSCGVSLDCAECNCPAPNQVVCVKRESFWCPFDDPEARYKGDGPQECEATEGVSCEWHDVCVEQKCCGPQNPNSANPTVPEGSNGQCLYDMVKQVPGTGEWVQRQESGCCDLGMACSNEDGTPACSSRPWGMESNLTGDGELPGIDLIFPAQREIHLTTTLPFLGVIFDETVGFEGDNPMIKPTFRLLTPYRGSITPEDPVPWYGFHDGDASGTLTIYNLGGENTYVNDNPFRTTTDFFFPYLGGIQDGTQFVRDCLTAAWPNGCTPPEVRQFVRGKTCTANFGKISIYTGASAEAEAFLATNPPVATFMDSGLSLAAGFNGVSVGRRYSEKYAQLGDALTRLPEAVAAEWMAEHTDGSISSDLSTYDNQKIYWQGFNEPVINQPSDMEWLARFEVERMRLLAAQGEKACIANFSVGNPNPIYWPSFKAAFEAAIQYDAIVCLHEYGLDNTTMQADGNTLGRFEQMYQYLATPEVNLASQIRTVISETGLDRAGNPDSDGWRAQLNNDSEAYLNALRNYDQYITSGSPYANQIIGATIFAIGIPGWQSFDISGEVIQAMTNGGNAGSPDDAISCIPNNQFVDGIDPGTGLPVIPPPVGPIEDINTPLGQMGNTGFPDCSTGAHLHLQIIDTNYPASQSTNNTQNHNPGFYLDPSAPHVNSIGATINGSRARYAWPMDNPYLTSNYGWRGSRFHYGLDMVGQGSTNVYPIAPGELSFADFPCYQGSNSIVHAAYVNHGNGVISQYQHLAY